MSKIKRVGSKMTFCSYNMGWSLDDFYAACIHRQPAVEMMRVQDHYNNVEIVAAARLSSVSPSLFFLQEMHRKDRPLIEALESSNFVVFQTEGLDEAIVISTTRYQEISGGKIQIRGQRVEDRALPVVTATDRITGLCMAFVSAHVPGFSFASMQQRDLAQQVRLASRGDDYSRILLQTLEEDFSDADVIVIGADMNANPEVWKARFDLFTEAGYRLVRTGKPTNVNPLPDEPIREREIDFFFVKENRREGLKSYLGSLIRKTYHTTASIDPRQPIPFMPNGGPEQQVNPSDHLPIFATLDHPCKTTPFDQWGFIPVIGTLIGSGRIVMGLVAAVISGIAWGVFGGILGINANPVKRFFCASLQHVAVGGIELIPFLKWGIEKLFVRYGATITLRVTATPVDAKPVNDKKTLGQHFWACLQSQQSATGLPAGVVVGSD